MKGEPLESWLKKARKFFEDSLKTNDAQEFNMQTSILLLTTATELYLKALLIDLKLVQTKADLQNYGHDLKKIIRAIKKVCPENLRFLLEFNEKSILEMDNWLKDGGIRYLNKNNPIIAWSYDPDTKETYDQSKLRNIFDYIESNVDKSMDISLLLSRISQPENMIQIPKDIKVAFAVSLVNSFITTPKTSERDGLPITTNGLSNGEVLSIDQWAGHNPRSTGGQEIVKVGMVTYTRGYAGGTISHEKLLALGISEKEVMGFLAKVVTENARNIRLDEDFDFTENYWQYHYECTGNNPNIPIWLGEEVIYYQNQLVFQHNFMICPVQA